MAVIVAILSALVGAFVWGHVMDKRARKRLERENAESLQHILITGEKKEAEKSDQGALDTLNENFGEGKRE